MDVETRYFLIFKDILRTAKNFGNHGKLFFKFCLVLFYKKLHVHIIFCKKKTNKINSNSWFLFLDKFQVQKGVDVITYFSCTVKKQKFKSIQAHSWTLPPNPFPMLSFSKCLVCFLVYLHHFDQYYLFFTGGT